MLMRLPCPVVFDHFVQLALTNNAIHPSYAVVRRLPGNGRTWIKLSGAYLDSQTGAKDGYADVDATAQAWANACTGTHGLG